MMKIGLVGGGASAVCFIDALVQSNEAPGSLTIFDPADRLWRGRPYRDDLLSVRLNSRADDMSVRLGDDAHFQRWLRAQGNCAEFLPRAVYGDYLAATAETGIAELRRIGWQVEIVHQAVVGAFRVGRELVLYTDDGLHKPVDHTILAVGGGPPSDCYGLAGEHRFIGDPFPLRESLSVIGSDDSVAVLGSGLTAVDVVLGLDAIGHRGRVSMVSRSGALPAVRQQPIDFEPTHLLAASIHSLAHRTGGISFSQIVDLIEHELSDMHADLFEVIGEVAAVAHEPIAQRLRRQLEAVESSKIAMRILQKALPMAGPDLWPLLADDLRQKILGRYKRMFMSLCCPMPPGNAQVLLGLMASGRLDVVDRLESVEPASGGFLISAGGTGYFADHVINGVAAPAHRIPLRAKRLVESLYDEGLAVPHQDGGLCVQFGSSLCNGVRRGGESSHIPGVYALGDIAAGTFFFTFGITSIVDRCRDILGDIVARHSEKHEGKRSHAS
ncbi:MAG: hypothetical protein GXY65_09970 [Rhodococcus sp.]|nr:hypothetical protein [Rhodococcus sp. (in: high G+C Gram-positive bacteria)]